MSSLTPFFDALKGVIADVVKRSAEAALDTVLEEAEGRVEAVGGSIVKARRNLRKPRTRPGDGPEVIVIDSHREGKRKRKRD